MASPGWKRETVTMALVLSPSALPLARLSIFTFGESLFTVTRKRYMDAVMPAIMNSNRPWRGFP
jgi:hypothetical protein